MALGSHPESDEEKEMGDTSDFCIDCERNELGSEKGWEALAQC